MTAFIAVPGNANPYLAGLPDGTIASSGDSAPDESPVLVTGLDISGGSVFTFNATGQVSLGTGLFPDPDGGSFINHYGSPENGFSDATIPRVALVGVFLDGELPTDTPAPAAIDFSGDALDYESLAPSLKQIFFIGDGVTTTGETQEVVAPEGATRLYLGTMDGFGWYNNTGAYEVIVNGPSDGSMTSTEGPDVLNGLPGDDEILGLGGNDTIDGCGGNDTLVGGDGDDRIVARDGTDSLVGGDGDDGIIGGGGNDVIDGGAGDDNIASGDGDDSAEGGDGNDFMGGGSGLDVMSGGIGNDTLGGGLDDDVIEGGEGDDVVAGGPGDDFIDGGADDDVMGASFGDDTVIGGTGNDDLGGGTGRDLIDAGAGNDSVGGGEGNDTIIGGTGDDFLAGGGREDEISGGAGRDTINGGAGSDTVVGGTGADIFVWNESAAGATDIVVDFQVGIDTLRLSGVENVPGSGLAGRFDALSISDTMFEGAAASELTYRDQVIVVAGVSAADLSIDDFSFF